MEYNNEHNIDNNNYKQPENIVKNYQHNTNKYIQSHTHTHTVRSSDKKSETTNQQKKKKNFMITN